MRNRIVLSIGAAALAIGCAVPSADAKSSVPTARVSCAANGDVKVAITTDTMRTITFVAIGDEPDVVRFKGTAVFRTGADLWTYTYSGQTVYPRDPNRNNC